MITKAPGNSRINMLLRGIDRELFSFVHRKVPLIIKGLSPTLGMEE